LPPDGTALELGGSDVLILDTGVLILVGGGLMAIAAAVRRHKNNP
jgi:hypothetical protein